jgi:hypothetical protein
MFLIDFIADCCKWAFIVLAVLIGLLLLVIAGERAVDHWDDPEYPYSGFQPDCPTWDEPLDPSSLPRPTEDEEE